VFLPQYGNANTYICVWISKYRRNGMGKITFVLSDGLESRLRKVAERKGDLSIIAERALDMYLKRLEELIDPFKEAKA
jgi:hypothetical protein